MSYTQSIDLAGDKVIAEEIRNFLEAFSPRRLNPRIGLDVVNLFQAHYRSLPPNEMGGRTTGFWKSAARSTHYKADNEGVTVSTTQQGVLQRFQGGIIRAIHAKYLAIPARAEAHGKSPRDFDNLHFIVTEAGPALVESDASKIKIGRKKKDGTRTIKQLGETGGGVMFWLRKSVRQYADPDIIPTTEKITEAILLAVRDQFQLLTSGGAS